MGRLKKMVRYSLPHPDLVHLLKCWKEGGSPQRERNMAMERIEMLRAPEVPVTMLHGTMGTSKLKEIPSTGTSDFPLELLSAWKNSWALVGMSSVLQISARLNVESS